MSVYLALNLAIISIPLLVTFVPRLKLYRNLPAFAAAFATIGATKIILDIYATQRGDWSFNPAYVLGWKWMGLPVEEIMFFVTVPWACTVIYEFVSTRIRLAQPLFNLNSRLFSIVAVATTCALAILTWSLTYTRSVLLSAAAVTVLVGLLKPDLWRSKHVWLYLGITYIPFLIVNTILTALPIVSYSSSAIVGLRVGTIPVEDFLYSFVMLSGYLAVYLKVKPYFHRV